jgi:ribosomal protein S12 methylthiotransferase accessory factor
LGEAIERYSGIYSGDEIRVRGKYSQMGESAIHPYAFIHYSESQYRTRHEWNQQHQLIQWVPDPFDEDCEIEWTPVWSLTHQVFKYLPTAYCYYGYPLPEDHGFCWSDTNGNAAGNTKEEAILQGFMELVERDAVALWWYNRVQRPGVQLESFDEPYLEAIATYYKTLSREFWVLDITSDLNIPTFAAISRRTNKQPEDILFGFGAHFDPKVALLRAVTEMNQMLFLSNALNPEGKATPFRQDIQTWCETATLENQPYLAPDTNAAPKVYGDYALHWSDDLREDVNNCVEIAAKYGLETLVLDQTRPDIGMSVVKAIVPGLRHFWAQLAPGRLYDVPVNLGWLEAPLTEDRLNPIPMFI